MDELGARDLIEQVQRRADADEPLALLRTAVTVAAEAGAAADTMLEHYVGAARATGISWTLIGDRLGVSKQAARQRFASRLQVSDLIADGAADLIVVPRLAACLQAARAAADAEGSVAGTQHLLLGLLHVGVAANILDGLGVTREKVRAASARLFEPVTITLDGRERRVVGDGEAEAAVTHARRLAARRGQSQVRSEHLLFCIAIDPGSAARRVLNELDIDTVAIKKGLEEWIAPVPRRRRGIRKTKATGRACSFCGCADPGPLVAGPGVWICGDCVQISREILRTNTQGHHTG